MQDPKGEFTPVIDAAIQAHYEKKKGQALIEEALTKGHDLMEEAKVASAKIGAKANGLRHGDKGRDTVSNVY